MKQNRAWVTAALVAATAIIPSVALGQAQATATQALQVSAFGGGTGTWTNLLGGRNLGITAGADLGFPTYRRFRPVLEVRGTFPIHSGQIDSQKNFLAGLKVERQYDRLHPYVNFLVGRGQIDYEHGGLQVGSFIYLYSTSTVFSPGLGVDYDLTDHWSMKADFQYQSWDVPFPVVDGVPPPVGANIAPGVSTGTIHPRVLTLGAVYRFDFNHYYKRPKHDRDLNNYPPPPPPLAPEPQAAVPPPPPPPADLPPASVPAEAPPAQPNSVPAQPVPPQGD